MSLAPTDVKRQLQDHLQEGLLLVVGSGLSAAEGIPGMGPLGQHLKRAIPARLGEAPDPSWNVVATALDEGDHLEAAMGKTTLLPTTVNAIVEETAKLVGDKELEVIAKVISGSRVLPFTPFARHLFKGGRQFHLITPNYDRLIEFATEAAGIGVDTKFAGNLLGHYDPKLSADAHRESFMNGKNAAFRPVAHLSVYKPHGSLDWFSFEGKVVRCPMKIDGMPVIITPGASKYRESFREVFDNQRTSGNRAVSHATRFMFIGYGFNDDHLEQHLCPNLRLTKPSVIMARTLSENARRVVKNSEGVQVIALSASPDTDARTLVTSSAGDELVIDEQLWNLDGFNKGVI